MNRADGIAVRLLRPWHGRPVGAVLRPPGALRQVLLESKDHSGTPFAELVEAQSTASKLPAGDPPVSKSRFARGRR